MKKSKRYNIVSLTDWHVPYEDEDAINVAFNFCGFIKPQVIIIHEAHDFYSVSKFDKDPTRINSLQNEIDKVGEYLESLRKLCPKSRIIMLNSNHLNRLKRYLWSNAPALAGLRSLEIDKLLELEKHNIEFMDYYIHNEVLFKHGDIVRQFSGYTARGEFLKESVSGVSGHTHRLGQYYSTKRGGSFTWVESGCLCQLTPEYINGIPDWQQGISVVSFERKNAKHFYSAPVPIIDNEIHWGEYKIVL